MNVFEKGDKIVVAKLLNLICYSLQKQNKYEESFAYGQKALVIFRNQNDDNENIAETMSNIADVLSKQGKYDEALDLYQRILIIYKKIQSTNSIETMSKIKILRKKKLFHNSYLIGMSIFNQFNNIHLTK